jgi:transglutaminase-like putative cysteine protease
MINRKFHQSIKTIRVGQDGVDDTVKLMQALVKEHKASSFIRELAFSIVESVPEKNEPAEIEAIFNYVQNNVRYTKDIHDLETLANPIYTLTIKHGDCDDHAVVLASLLQTIGYQTCFVTTTYDEPFIDTHVYVVVFVDGQEIFLDSTEKNKNAGYEIENWLRRTIHCG